MTHFRSEGGSRVAAAATSGRIEERCLGCQQDRLRTRPSVKLSTAIKDQFYTTSDHQTVLRVGTFLFVPLPANSTMLLSIAIYRYVTGSPFPPFLFVPLPAWILRCYSIRSTETRARYGEDSIYVSTTLSALVAAAFRACAFLWARGMPYAFQELLLLQVSIDTLAI